MNGKRGSEDGNGKFIANINVNTLSQDIMVWLERIKAAMIKYYSIITKINERADEDDFIDQTQKVEDVENK